MHCSEVMKRDVAFANVDSLVAAAADVMKDRDVGFLPICDESGAAVGTLTDRDITIRVVAAGHDPQRTTAREVMTRPVVSCAPDDDLAVIEDLMEKFQKARIVCTDEQRRVVGVVSLTDVAEHDALGHSGAVAASIAAREASQRRGSLPMVNHLRCRQVMRPLLRCSPQEHTVAFIATKMRDDNVGFVPICDDEGVVIGALTDRDITVRVVAARLSAVSTRVQDVFTPEIVFCSPDDTLKTAEDLMMQHKKSRIVCVDRMLRPVGIISLSDVARIDQPVRVSRVLSEISRRSAPT